MTLAHGGIDAARPHLALLHGALIVNEGRNDISADVATRLAVHLADEDLTARELDVFRLIRDGYRNKQIAAHRRSCFRTLPIASLQKETP